VEVQNITAEPESPELSLRPEDAGLERHSRSTRFIGACALLASIAIAGACSVSPQQEREIGAADAAHIDSQMPLIRDTVIDKFVRALGQSMASRTSRANLDWHFSVVNSPEVNAFALPGGFIYVNRGAIEHADRLDELAGVMGHEIGHVVKRHSVAQIEQAEKGQVGVVLLCTLTPACRSLGGLIAIRIGADAKSAHYSQKDEAEADSEGVVNTVRAGIDPEGLPSFFQKLLDQRAQQPTAFEAFFSTHPTDQSRVSATRKQIEALPRSSLQNLMRDTPEFHAIQARVKAFPPPPKPPADTASPRK
jgi:predicted Zn-dependent protease